MGQRPSVLIMKGKVHILENPSLPSVHARLAYGETAALGKVYIMMLNCNASGGNRQWPVGVTGYNY